MLKRTKPQLEPRKTPVQSRSNASVGAIREATIQVLLKVGKERLTTTRVAARAGVSVGTLYQYFPNKSSLLQAVLREHMEEVGSTIEAVCRRMRGAPLDEMADALAREFIAAKLKNLEASQALYFVSDDVGGAEIVRRLGGRSIAAVTEMLDSSGVTFRQSTHVVAMALMSAIAGVSKRMLEASQSPETIAALKQELMVMVRAYLNACTLGRYHPDPRTGVR